MKVLAVNRKVLHDYEIKDKEVAGIKLEGHEVKSVKTGHISLEGAYVIFYRGEPYLVGANIPLYKYANSISRRGYDPTRRRKLLLTRSQIEKWARLRQEKKWVIVPLRILSRNGLIKIELGIGKHLKKREKRKREKERTEKRKIERQGRLGYERV